MLDYPISTFLFWHVDDSNISWDTYCCAFREKIVFDSRKQPDDANYELTNINTKITNTAVLDGQQRLTALLLSLYGEVDVRPNYSRKKNGSLTITKLLIELNKHKIDVDEEEYNSKKFDIRFSDKVSSKGPTQFEVRSILGEKFQNDNTREQAIEDAIVNVPSDSKDYARDILNKLFQKIFKEKLIRYTEITDMKQDDALEMFVRFNSGGKALKKSEITMSILEAYWPSAKTEFGKILVGAYEHFDTDFIIRTALMLYGDVLKSNISKKVVDELKNNWSAFKMALNNLEDVLKELRIDLDCLFVGWNVLLPVIAFVRTRTILKTRRRYEPTRLGYPFFLFPERNHGQAKCDAELHQQK